MQSLWIKGAVILAGIVSLLVGILSMVVTIGVGGITTWLFYDRIGAGLINIAGIFLGLAQLLLDTAMEYTIVNFNGLVSGTVLQELNLVWTLFRDLGNIVIIGMFTFIAISTIIGNESFGARKLIARVLIIAVLINFSLFFTRIIIESSNFVARNFYEAMIPKNTNSANGSSQSVTEAVTNNVESQGISASFVKMTGLTSALNARETLQKIADAADGRWPAIFYSIGVSLLFVVLAAVLLYIVGLLVVRTVLLIFLMVTSSLAFAAYLIPQFSNGWSTWWSALLRNAVFAPLLMVLLWVDLRVGSAIAGAGSGGTFDSLFSLQNSTSAIEILLIYCILIGMLIATALFANSFSSQIAGFDFAKTLSFGIPLGLSASLAGFAGRNFLGRDFAKRSEALGKDVEKINRLIDRVPEGAAFDRRRAFLQNRLSSLEESKRFTDKIAGGKFVLGGTDIGKKILKAAGTPSALGGDGKNITSFGEAQKRTAEEAAKRAAEITKLSSKDTAAISDSATKVLRDQRDVMQESLKVSKQNAAAEERTRAAEIQKHESDIRVAESNIATWQRTRPAGPVRDADLNTQKNRIETARQEISKLREQFRKNAGVDELETKLDEIKKTIEKTGKDAVIVGKANVRAAGETLARDIAYRRPTNIVPWALGGDPEKDQTSRQARSIYNKKVGDAGKEDDILAAIQRRLDNKKSP